MKYRVFVLILFLTLLNAKEFSVPMQEYMKALKQEAKKNDVTFSEFSAQRGENIFLSKNVGKRGKPISCSSCHKKELKQEGKNTHTGKVIKPLSPLANPERLSDAREVKKWLRRNFKDVYNREGNALEKGDVLTYIKNN